MPDRTVETQIPSLTEEDGLERLDVLPIILALESPVSDVNLTQFLNTEVDLI